jgi:TonB family protein
MTNATRSILALSAATVLAAVPAHAQSADRAPTPANAVEDCARASRQPMLINERAVARKVSRSYPRQLLDSGVHGRALLQLTVGPGGRVEEVTAVDATHRPFAAAARAYAQELRFAPAMVDGAPVRCSVTVPVDFALADG